MKTSFKWMANNVALTFLFVAESLCFIYGIGWAISLQLKEERKEYVARVHEPLREPLPEKVLIIAEEGLAEFASNEMEVFALSDTANYTVVSLVRNNAIKVFAKNETALLILSAPLHEAEIAAANLQPERLPLIQESVDNSFMDATASPILVKDNVTTNDENLIAAFLEDNASQYLVMQSIKNKTAQNATASKAMKGKI